MIEESVQVDAGGIALEGDLAIPEGATGIVVFAHGSGSSRHSSRNRFVASSLRDAGLATLLFDLLTSDEEREDIRTAHHRFDIPMLAKRLVGTARWLKARPDTGPLRIGLFGASTGGGAALVAAAEAPELVAAVVSRGGRPDLAGAALPNVKAPTLLIVGGRDRAVIQMNREAFDQLLGEARMEIVSGATHLFEEAGALEQVALLAREWFLERL